MGACGASATRAAAGEGRVVEVGDPEQIGERYLELNFSAEARGRAQARAADGAARGRRPWRAEDDPIATATAAPRSSTAGSRTSTAKRATVVATGQAVRLAMRAALPRDARGSRSSRSRSMDDEHRIFMDAGNTTSPGRGRVRARRGGRRALSLTA
jgi:hypothetical protein